MKTPAQYFAMLKNLKCRHYWVINREQNETIVMPRFIWIINIMCSRVISCGSLEQIQKWEATKSKDIGLDYPSQKKMTKWGYDRGLQNHEAQEQVKKGLLLCPLCQ